MRPLTAERVVVTAAFLAALAALTFLAMIWWSQRQLLYFPAPGRAPAASAFLPGALDVMLETEDGLHLGAYFVAAATTRSGATILVCNGNAGDRTARLGLARALVAAGHNVLVFDYRGFARNPGTPTEGGLNADARAALAYLESRVDLDRSRIVYFGESLGSAVATRLAVERPPLALVLRSPFTSVVDVGRIHYPYLPVVDGLLFDHYQTIDTVRSVRVPTLVVAGANDRIVPPTLSQRVSQAAGGPSRFVLVPHAGHNDPQLAEGDALISAMLAFLDDVEGGRPIA